MTIESAMMYSTLTNISQRFYLKSIGRLQQLVIIGINPQLTRVDEIEQLFEDKRIHVVNHHSVFIFQQPIISNSGIIFLKDLFRRRRRAEFTVEKRRYGPIKRSGGQWILYGLPRFERRCRCHQRRLAIVGAIELNPPGDGSILPFDCLFQYRYINIVLTQFIELNYLERNWRRGRGQAPGKGVENDWRKWQSCRWFSELFSSFFGCLSLGWIPGQTLQAAEFQWR